MAEGCASRRRSHRLRSVSVRCLDSGNGKAAARGFLERAMSEYGGDLLPPAYEDFVLAERARLRTKCLAGLEQLVELCAVEGDYRSAIRWSEAVLRLEPLRESACRRLMQFHERSGNRGRRASGGTLNWLIDCSMSCKPRPMRQVRRFFKPLNRGMLQRRPPGKKAHTQIPLIGRSREWEQLHEAWRRAQGKTSQMVLIRGDAGVGKTRLAEEMLMWAEAQGIPNARLSILRC